MNLKKLLIIFFMALFLIACDKNDINWSTNGLEFSLYGDEYYVTGYSGVSENVKIPNTYNGKDVTRIIEHSFLSSNIKNIYISKNLQQINAFAFNSSKLENIYFEEGSKLTLIDQNAFLNSNLKTINIPESVKELYSNTFTQTPKLETINVSEDNLFFRSLDGVLFTKNKDTLIKYPEAKVGNSYTVPSSVETIDGNSFGYALLENITISKNVRYINSYAFGSSNLRTITFEENSNIYSIGEDVFAETNISSITLPASLSYVSLNRMNQLSEINVEEGNGSFQAVDNVLYNYEKTVLLKYPENKTGSLYTILDNVISIENNAFSNNYNLESITIPDSVEKIDYMAFYNARKLKTINISENSKLNKIYEAFYEIPQLEEIYIPSKIEELSDYEFYYLPSLRNYEVHPDNSVFSQLNGVLFNKDQTVLLKVPSKRTGNYLVPLTVEEISVDAFYNSNLESVTLQSEIPPKFLGQNLVNTQLKIYVPDNLVSVYKNDSSWSNLESQIFSIE